MRKEKKCLIQEERKDLKGLSGIVLPFFRLGLFLSARYTLGISELGIHTKMDQGGGDGI